jgi:hypothetical protein
VTSLRSLLAVALAAGCGGGPAEPPARVPAPPSAAPSAATAAAPDAPVAESDADDVVAQALAIVVEKRQLAALHPVKNRVIGREALAEQMKREVLTDLEPELVRGITENLYAFGTVPADLDYEKTILKVLGSQLAGYYDPRNKTMFLLDDLGSDGSASTLWHELVHALQDQHYDLRPKLKWSPGRGDATSAIQSFAEGDAMHGMLDVMVAPQGHTALDLPAELMGKSMGVVEALPELSSVPAILKRALVAPYADGMTFVTALRQKGGFAAVDAAWRDPPTTTEQILHPEKYEAREPAVVIAPLSPPDAGPKPAVFRDVLGEQGLRFLFEEWVPLVTAARSASGWGGDQLAVFAEGERRAVAVHLVFDDAVRATDALQAFARGALAGESDAGTRTAVTPEQAGKAAQLGHVCAERSRRGPFAVVRIGRDLGVTLGPYRREGSATLSDSDCPSGLRWARAVASAKP